MHILRFLPLLSLILSCRQSTFSDSRFEIDNVGFKGKMQADTNYYTDYRIAAIGYRPIDKHGQMAGLKVGLWTTYYHNGQVRSMGNYEMYSLLYDSYKSIRLETSYKIGPWAYYYENGQVQAKGKYQIINVEAKTGVDNQMHKKSITSNSWAFYNPDGTPATDKEKIVSDIEHVYHE